jgi:hypothetical protein
MTDSLANRLHAARNRVSEPGVPELLEEAAREISRLTELADTWEQCAVALGAVPGMSQDWPDDT